MSVEAAEQELHAQRCTHERRAHIRGGIVTWIHARQYDHLGRLSFEIATNFALNGERVDDRFGEHLLDVNALRIDATRRPDS